MTGWIDSSLRRVEGENRAGPRRPPRRRWVLAARRQASTATADSTPVRLRAGFPCDSVVVIRLTPRGGYGRTPSRVSPAGTRRRAGAAARQIRDRADRRRTALPGLHDLPGRQADRARVSPSGSTWWTVPRTSQGSSSASRRGSGRSGFVTWSVRTGEPHVRDDDLALGGQVGHGDEVVRQNGVREGGLVDPDAHPPADSGASGRRPGPCPRGRSTRPRHHCPRPEGSADPSARGGVAPGGQDGRMTDSARTYDVVARGHRFRGPVAGGLPRRACPAGGEDRAGGRSRERLQEVRDSLPQAAQAWPS